MFKNGSNLAKNKLVFKNRPNLASLVSSKCRRVGFDPGAKARFVGVSYFFDIFSFFSSNNVEKNVKLTNTTRQTLN